MLLHRGFSAWITVEDEALPEFLVAVDDEDHRVSCWVPGEEGKKFTVWWTDHGGQVDTCSFISLDGVSVPGRFLLGSGTASRSGARADPLRERPFQFIQVPENTQGAEDSNGDVGTIILKIKRVRRIDDVPANTVDKVPESVSGKRKTGDLCAGLGPVDEAAKPQYPRTWKCVPYDPTPGNSTHPSTYVSFVFRYRTREFLEAQGIAEKKKSAPSRRTSVAAEPRSGEKRRASGPPTPVANEYFFDSHCPSPPKRPRPSLPGNVFNDQTALGIGHAPSHGPPSDLRRSISYYRAQAYLEPTPQPPSPQTVYHPSPQTEPPNSQPQSVSPTPVSFQPTELRTEGCRPNATRTSVPSSATFNPCLNTTGGNGQGVFLLPRTPSQSRVPSLTQSAPEPLPAVSALGLSGLPVQAHPYYSYSGSAVGAPVGPGSNPHTGMALNVPVTLPSRDSHGFHWVPGATMVAPPSQGRKVTPSALVAIPSMGALSDATTPSPGHFEFDEGHRAVREHQSQRRESVAQARRQRRVSATQRVQGALLD